MKINGILSAALIFCIAINLGCTKNESLITVGGSSTQSTDPAVNILGRWQVLKDSIVVENFAFPGGEVPVAGVYRGRSSDYWNFQDNGTVYIYQGGPVGYIDYFILGNNLLMPAFEWGNVTVLTLSTYSLIWEKSITNNYGGKYYRRAYFRR